MTSWVWGEFWLGIFLAPFTDQHVGSHLLCHEHGWHWADRLHFVFFWIPKE